ncbi:PREDICTED: Golgi-associated plant pathogenesis-related protein 1-like [Branchiostoma belcheri]|uniref:Golgi-associated plant pathogenesis-related protein 1-like n=1 Tax=Branchiostoma belcheri TaxID=7741 RepID=A0A6P4ZH37_BRABE|nr:PREDICTED: Golgi-associated plant pathogenesis-related protein 1-like [Branchiostoma belcheri]
MPNLQGNMDSKPLGTSGTNKDCSLHRSYRRKTDLSAKMTEFAKNCLAVHNELRAKHGAPALKLSDKLTEHAQKWADHLAKIGKLEHSEGSGYGENVAMQWGDDVPARSFVQQWYSEVERYDFGDKGGNYQPSAGHFSQVVWKGSKELGVGTAKSDKGMAVTVCNYSPPGNMQGAFGSNVQSEN